MGWGCLAAESPPEKRGAFAIAACFAVAVCIYANSLTGDFVFDDHEAIENNPDVRLDTPLSSVFSNDFWGHPISSPDSHKSYRPLTVLTFRWNRQLHGMHPLGFHIVNVLLHGLVCVLFHLVLQSVGTSLMISLTTVLLFATHPIHTEAVANIAGRSEMLSAAFFLAAILAHRWAPDVSSAKHGNHLPPQQCRWQLWLRPVTCIALGGVATLCKEQGITCLGVCVVHDMFTVARIFWQRDKQRRLWRETVPRLVVVAGGAAAILVVRIIVLGGGGKPRFTNSDNPASFADDCCTRLMTYLYLCAFNFWLLLCPSSLCFDWSMGSIPLVTSLTDPRNLCSLLFFLFLASLSVRALWSCSVAMATTGTPMSNVNFLPRGRGLKDADRLLLALSLLALPFLPASNLFFPVGFVVAERVLYIPSMGFCLLVAVGMERVSSNTGNGGHQRSSPGHPENRPPFLEPPEETKKRRSPGMLITLVLCYLLVVSVCKTMSRNADWRTTLQLAQDALRTNPGNAKVHFTMGNVLTQQGNRTCELYYQQAIALRPNYTLAWTNLGLVLLNTDRAAEAEQCYNRALAIQPDHATANTNMAHLCRLQGRWEEALKHYRVAGNRRPGDPRLRYYAAQMLDKLSQTEEAVVVLREGLALHDNYAEAHLLLGSILAHSQKKSSLSQAQFHLQKAVQLRPDDPQGLLELGRLLVWRKQWSAATNHLTKAVSLDPDLADATALLHRIRETNSGGSPLPVSKDPFHSDL